MAARLHFVCRVDRRDGAIPVIRDTSKHSLDPSRLLVNLHGMKTDAEQFHDTLAKRAAERAKPATERLIDAVARGWRHDLPPIPTKDGKPWADAPERDWQRATNAWLKTFDRLAKLLARWHETAAGVPELAFIARGLGKPDLERFGVAMWAAPNDDEIGGPTAYERHWYVHNAVMRLYMTAAETARQAYHLHYKRRGIKLNCKHLPELATVIEPWKELLPELHRAGLSPRRIGKIYGKAHTTIIRARPDLFGSPLSNERAVATARGEQARLKLDAAERRRRMQLDAKNSR